MSTAPSRVELAILRSFGMRGTRVEVIADAQGQPAQFVEQTIAYWAQWDQETAKKVVAECESPREPSQMSAQPAPSQRTPAPKKTETPPPPEKEPKPKRESASKPPVRKPLKKVLPVSEPEDDEETETAMTPAPAPAAETPEPAAETLPPTLVIPAADPPTDVPTIETLLARAAASTTHTTRTLAAKIRAFLAELDHVMQEEADEATLTEEVSRRVSALIAEAERLQQGGVDALARAWAQQEGIPVDADGMVPPMVKLRYLRSR